MKLIGCFIILLGFNITVITMYEYLTHDVKSNTENFSVQKSDFHNLNWTPVIGIVVVGIGGICVNSSKR
jgi:hypothetical protein